VGDPFEGVRRAYDTVAGDYAASFPDTRPEAPLDLAMIDALADAVGAEPVLDAGCGTGRMSRYLTGRGCTVAGVDLSPGMVAEARRAQPGVSFTVGSLTDLPYGEGSFAGVLLWYSVIHVPSALRPRIFAEVVRVLRPGGHVLVGFQSGSGTRDVAPAYRAPGHEIELHRYLATADQIVSELAAAGLSETARLVRRARATERDGQAIVLAAVSP
jgi:SAM-dependent methyltransferase